MYKRREFLKATGVFTTGSLILPYGCTQKKKPAQSEEVVEIPEQKNVGLQLYTLRNEIETEGIVPVLERVAKLGYTWMEGFKYENRTILGLAPAELKKVLDDLGMSMPSVHAVTEVSSDGGKDAVIRQMAESAEDVKAVGAKYLVWAFLEEEDRQSIEDYKRHMVTWNQFGKVCKENGLQFTYHNHDFEFLTPDGFNAYDTIMENTDPDEVKFELDLYWITKAGYDPVEYFNKAPGRFPLWHVKDMIDQPYYSEDGEERYFAEVGNGVIDFARIFKARETAGLDYFFVEQDFTQKTPFESIEISINYLQNADFV
jgi:sugar phosphate isomerase/epimerase